MAKSGIPHVPINSNLVYLRSELQAATIAFLDKPFGPVKGRQREDTMEKKYTSGTFCVDIRCNRHADLEGLYGDAYLEKKIEHCKDCYAWRFLTWLNERGYRIVHTLPEISAREMAARIKGLDPVTVEDLTIDEIMTL